MSSDFEDLLRPFNDSGVRYLVAGGRDDGVDAGGNRLIVLYSEDSRHGSIIAEVPVVNPFGET